VVLVRSSTGVSMGERRRGKSISLLHERRVDDLLLELIISNFSPEPNHRFANAHLFNGTLRELHGGTRRPDVFLPFGHVGHSKEPYCKIS
jgi:hypothetical protein